MDSFKITVSLLFITLAVALHTPNAHSYQNLAIATGELDFFRNPVTNFNSARFSANDPIYDPGSRTVTTTRPYNVTGLDGKTYQATITKTAAADIPKVGAALSKFAQRVGPLSMALATADLICTLSSICKSASDTWEIPADPDLAGYPSTSPVYKWAGYNGAFFPDPYTACNSPAYLAYRNSVSASPSMVTETNYSCGFVTSTGVHVDGWTGRLSGCADKYVLSGSACVLSGNKDPKTATSSDWTAKESQLSTPAAADRLAAELEPLPIQVPSVFAPISVPLGTATATNKDALGNATGTQQTTRRLDIEDAATEAEPYRVTVKETETVTNYDLNNSPLSSTETVKQSDTPAEPPPPEDIEIDFDESVDRDLQTFEVPGLFSYTPFGGAGSCPADITENTKFGNVTMSYAPVCRVAEGVRPFVILLAIISAFFIVSGSRQS